MQLSDSIYQFCANRGPINFDSLVEAVQGRIPEASRNAVAMELGGLCRSNRVALNIDATGFVANKSYGN